MMKKSHNPKWRRLAMLLAVVLLLTATGCGKKSNTTDTSAAKNAQASITAQTVAATASGLHVEYEAIPALTADTVIALNQTDVTIDGTGAAYENGVLSISKGGVYAISGTLSDGQIVVNAADKNKVYLILNGVSVSSSRSAPLYVLNAKCTILWLADGSTNTFADAADGETADVQSDAETTTEAKVGTEAETETDTPNATIYAKDDLVIAGAGALYVTGNGDNAINGKDWVQLLGGDIHVTAVNHGIKGKDYLAVNGANIIADVGGDGLKSSNNTDVGKGFVLIDSGTIDITAKGDGISGETQTFIAGATITVNAGDAANASTQSNSGADPFDRGMNEKKAQASEENETSEDTASMKGIKAGDSLTVTGGTITVNAVSHALHSTGATVLTGGTLTLSSISGKGISAHGDLTVDGSSEIVIHNATEALESKQSILLNDGSVRILKATDDALNTGGEVAQADAADHRITINGGYLYLYTERGDGIDSNGDLVLNGGTVVVIGSANGGNSCFDSQFGITYSGGTVLGIGATNSMWAQDMANGLSGDYIVNTTVGDGADSIAVVDANKTVLAYLDHTFSGVSIGAIFFGSASGDLADCSFVSGGIYSDKTNADGYASGGTLSGGTAVSPSSISGGMGGMGGNMRDGMGGGEGGMRGGTRGEMGGDMDHP